MRKGRLLTLLLLMVACVIGVHSFARADVSVEAILSDSTFSLDEGARLSIVANGVSSNVTVEEPEIDNIKLHPRGQSSQTSYINGTMSASITYNYIVQGLAAGKYTIPPITVRVGNDTYTTKAIPFEITPGGTSSNTTTAGAKSIKDIAFITISETGEHYPGEIVPITLKAYFNRNFRIDLNSLPALSGDGVVMPQLSSEPEQNQEEVAGVPYHVLTWHTSLSGVKSGTHKIQFSLDATLLVQQQRRSSPFSQFGGSLFDDSIFDNFFGNVQRKPIRATSLEHDFTVLPLPQEGQPAGFTGAIGDFTLKVTGTPLDVEVGEPITLTMTIAGQGNFNRVEAPVFPESQAWKTYSPTSAFDANNADFNGSKSFEQAIVVKQPGVTEIPSLSFSFFSPAKKEYVTLTSAPIPLHVKAGSGQRAVVQQDNASSSAAGSVSVAPAPAVTANVPSQAPDTTSQQPFNLAPIHLETGSFHGRIVPLFQRLWFIACIVILLCAIAALVVLNIRKSKYDREPGLARKEKRQMGLRGDIQRIEDAKRSGDAVQFLECCRAAIKNHVGENNGREASAMSLTDLKKHVPGDSSLIEIFARAEAAAYGGGILSADEMDTYCRELKSELEKM